MIAHGDGDSDRLIGGSASDELYGDAGDDHISGPAATIDGGDGNDLVELSSSIRRRRRSPGGTGSEDRLVLHLTDAPDTVSVTNGGTFLNVSVNGVTSMRPASSTSSSTGAAAATPSRSATSTAPA